jgi:uncharacterized membrane protein
VITAEQPRTRQDTTWIAALALAVIVRAWNLGRLSFSMDEVWELQIANAPWGDIHKIEDGFPPLFHYVLKALHSLGAPDTAARWLASAAGLATIYVVYRLGNAVDPSRTPRLGLIAATVMAWMPLHVHISREGRVYSLAVLAAAVAMWATWELTGHDREPRTWSWAVYGIAVLTGLWLHYGLAALALVLAPLTFVYSGDRRRWWLTHAAVAALTLPLIFPLLGDLTTGSDPLAPPEFGLAQLGYTAKSLLFGFALGPSSRALHTISVGEAIRQSLGWLVLLTPAVGYLTYRSWHALERAVRRFLLVVLVSGAATTSVLILAGDVGFQVRYFAWLMIPIAIWVGGALTQFTRPTAVALAVCVVAVVASIGGRELSEDHRTEDAVAVAEYLSSSGQQPAFALSWYTANPVNYYLTPEVFLPLEDPGLVEQVLGPRDKPGQAVRPLSTGSRANDTPASLLALIDEDTQPGDHYFFLYARPFHGDPDGTFLAILTARDHLELVFEAAGYEVYSGFRSE